MTPLLVAAVGRPRTPGMRDAIREYEDRLRHYFKFESVEVDAARLPDRRAGEARDREASSLARRVPPDLELIALTREGKPWSTRELARHLGDKRDYGGPGTAFVIGGAHGLGAEILDRASTELRLSRMTLPHEMARLFLTEQLYRAGTILRGEPYHKGP